MKNIQKIFIITALFISFATLKTEGQNQPKSKRNQSAQISGNFQYDIGDTIILTIWSDMFSLAKKEFIPHRQLVSRVTDNTFKFMIDSIENISYISIGTLQPSSHGAPVPILDFFLLEPGDNVNIQERLRSNMQYGKYLLFEQTSDFFFTGKGSEKFQCRWDLVKNKRMTWETESKRFEKTDLSSLLSKFQHQLEINEKVIRNGEHALMKFKRRIPDTTFDLMKVDIYAEAGMEAYGSLIMNMPGRLEDTYNPADISEAQKYFNSAEPKFIAGIVDNKMASVSPYYPSMQIANAVIEARFYKNETYEILRKKLRADQRDRILTAYFFNNPDMRNFQGKIKDALDLVESNGYRDILIATLKNQSKGSQVTDFELQDSNGRFVKLSDFRGKLVFIDFYFVGCGGCSVYYQNTLSKVEQAFANNPDIVFMTISIDVDMDKWKKGLESGIYTSTHAVNLNTGKLGIKHPLIKQLAVISYPNPILLDREGKILIYNKEKLLNATPIELIHTINKAIRSESL